MGYSGPRLTWTNGRGGMGNTLVRLDRALANSDWRLKFPEAAVENIPHTYSDHCPVIVNTEGISNHNIANNLSKPFRFHTCWLDHLDVDTVINDRWSPNHNLITNLDN